MAQPVRLSRLLKSVNRAVAQSHDTPFRDGPAYVRCNSGVTIWSAGRIEEQRTEADEQHGQAPWAAIDSADESAASPPEETAELAGGEDVIHNDIGADAADEMLPCADDAKDADVDDNGDAGDVRDAANGDGAAMAAPAVSDEEVRSTLPTRVADGSAVKSSPAAPAYALNGGVALMQPMCALTHKMLGAIETQLAMEIGPVARVLVAKYAGLNEDLASLGAHLESHISSEQGRGRFKKALRALSEAALHGNGTDTTQACLRTLQLRQENEVPVMEQRGAPTPQQVHAAGSKLAAYLGPIAHVIAKREAQSVLDLDTLLQRLTESIRNDADRNGFRQACREIRQG